MTHDPLCPRIEHALEHWVSDCVSPECDEIACQCDLIAKVRADENMVCYAKHLELDYERTRESWEAGYKEGKAAASAT